MVVDHKAVHHQLDVYGVWLHVTRSKKQWRAWRTELDLKDLPAKIHSVGLTTRTTERDGTMHLCVFIDHKLTGAGLVEIVAHESTHAGGMLLDAIDQKYDGCSEALAYLVAWLTVFIWRYCTGTLNPAP